MSEKKKETEKKEPPKKKSVKVKETKTEEVTVKKAVKKEKKVTPKEETNEVLLNVDEQKKVHTLSRIIAIFMRVGKILMMIIVPFIFITMIAIPVIFNKLEVSGNIVSFDSVRLVVNDKHLSIKLPDGTYVSNEEIEGLDEIVDFLSDNSKGKIVAYIETALVFVGAILIIEIYLLSYIENLFNNFYYKNTPFIEENANYMRKIGRFMIIRIAISIVMVIVLRLIINSELSVNFDSYGILEILIIYCMYYIFTYAYRLQEKNNTLIYDEKRS